LDCGLRILDRARARGGGGANSPASPASPAPDSHPPLKSKIANPKSKMEQAMITVPPLPFLRRRRVTARPPAPPAPSVTVVSATATGVFEVTWVFSEPVTLTGTDVPELEVDGIGLGFTGPDSVTQTGEATLVGDYSSASGIASGDRWRILSEPSALTPALVVPQSGNLS
jgi:hypothetical protein